MSGMTADEYLRDLRRTIKEAKEFLEVQRARREEIRRRYLY